MKLIYSFFCAFVMSAAVFAAGTAPSIPLLQTRTYSFTNVVVTDTTPERIFIRHAGGLTSVRVADLTAENRTQLGMRPLAAEPSVTPPAKTDPRVSAKPAEKAADTTAKTSTAQRSSVFGNGPRNPVQDWLAAARGRVSRFTDSWTYLAGLLGAIVLLWIVYGTMMWMICERSGIGGTLVVFLPFLRWIPILRAADMKVAFFWLGLMGYIGAVLPPRLPAVQSIRLGYWIVILTLQVIWLCTLGIWCFRICTSLDRSRWIGLFLLLPGTHPFALLALAFGGKRKELVVTEAFPIVARAPTATPAPITKPPTAGVPIAKASE